MWYRQLVSPSALGLSPKPPHGIIERNARETTLALLITGGVLSNSLAIATDAAHLLTDFASFMISLFALYIATLPATKKMSFGYYRAEVVGALASVLMIWVVTGVLVLLAVERVKSGDYDIDSVIMLITSGLGVAVNLVMGAVLHQHGHSHGGSSASSVKHSHDEEGGHHSHGANLNVRAAFIHVVGDLLQSIGVFVAALFIYFKPSWKIADPICTFVFSILVMMTTFAIIRDALRVLMEGIPRGIDYNDVQEIFQGIPGVIKVHNLRIWALSMDKTAVSCHLAIKSGYAQQDILNEAIQRIRAKYDIFDMTLQIEYYSEEMGTCDQCQPPKD